MAKQRTKTMEEQLEEMKAQLAKNQQELEAKKDELGTYSACDPFIHR
jgi:ribosome-interacting GTPase 1